MKSFSFVVNKSYLLYYTHPVTIPKDYYKKLEMSKLIDGSEIRIICHEGTRVYFINWVCKCPVSLEAIAAIRIVSVVGPE